MAFKLATCPDNVDDSKHLHLVITYFLRQESHYGENDGDGDGDILGMKHRHEQSVTS